MLQKAQIPDGWEGGYCCYAVKWPKSPKWEGVLRGILTVAREGRFWNENTGYIKGAQSVINETLDWNLQLWEVIMSCGDNEVAQAILDGLNAIASATAQASASAIAKGSDCCEQVVIDQNGGHAGMTTETETQPSQPIFGTVPPESVAPGEFPEGYASLEEYNLDKCQVANLIM